MKFPIIFLFLILGYTRQFTIGKVFNPTTFLIQNVSSPHSIGNQVRNAECSRHYTFDEVGQSIFINSIGFPFGYPINRNCIYTFQSPPQTKLQLVTEEFNVEYSKNCQFDFFKIYPSLKLMHYTDSAVRNYCGLGTINEVSASNNLGVWFSSDSSSPSSIYPFRYRFSVTVIGEIDANPTEKPPVGGQGGPNHECSCGQPQINIQPKIVGGRTAIRGSYPWRCTLITSRLANFCGCSIIHNEWILTAAHCLVSVKPTEDLWVLIGAHDIRTDDNGKSYVVKVESRFVHEQYNKTNQNNDVAVLKLQQRLTYSDHVQPVCLPFKLAGEDFSGYTVSASGWGMDAYAGGMSPVLQEVELSVLETEACRTLGKYPSSFLTFNMICTYTKNKDTCQGDSGGSVDWIDPQTGRRMAVGIISWGIGCAAENKPGVYARLTNYTSWIEAKTRVPYCKI